MCPKNCPPPADMKTRSKSSMPGKPKKKQKQTLASLTNPSRRSRTKIRRPKFLSLGLQISPQSSRTSAAAAAPAPQMNRTYHRKTVRRHRQKHQLELFPLHPGAHLANGGDGGGDQGQQLQDENDVALLFDSAAAAAAATLTGLLDPAAPAPAVAAAAAASSGVVEEEESAVSSLIRCAMKSSSRERGESEEKWVCYSEVIVEAEKKAEMEEVTSCAADAWRGGRTAQQGAMLSLKLDYQEILDAWSDKGSLFVCGGDANHETPQTVPDLMRVDNGAMDGWENVWTVPEKAAESEAATINRDVTMEDGGEFSDKIRQREASVMRYKEKRHSRLFSKRIRYEVRKLNAQKRPRIKGRFVRRDCED
ncbi:uncharacterized protein LOC115672627 isoform X2 [Syzygium oleosum]|uniref:uncharacterized protein LOC115672627 isoform X2 n=1 Tax=Syzygium oleosum TaxID=219896 RepID=UPI0024B97FCF|nr:uncharacterized protein LOC115672627 isoform X2 [Syzygium oleosum]